jgi:glycosyltransferase involved in cell wall biosynthesis
MSGRRTAVLVTSHPGQRPVEELATEAEAGRRPRVDYVELARATGGDIIDLHQIRKVHGEKLPWRLTRRHPLGRAGEQVWTALTSLSDYDRVVAWADRLGLPLALAAKLTRRPIDLVMISVLLTSPKKALLIDRLRAHSHLRAIVTPSSVQADKAVKNLGVPAAKVHHFPQRVDHRFWRVTEERPGEVISSVGWENRDYATLVAAARDLDAPIEVAIGSVVLGPVTAGRAAGRSALESLRQTSGYRRLGEWEAALASAPDNLQVRHQLSHLELRALYERSKFCVLPLHEIDTDNGATALAEAMAMGRAVIVTRTTGQVDILREGEHGLMVPPGDPRALREAMQHLLDHPEEAERMGRAGRAEVERRHTLDGYIARLVELLDA